MQRNMYVLKLIYKYSKYTVFESEALHALSLVLCPPMILQTGGVLAVIR